MSAPADLAAAISAVSEAVSAACSDPADQIRLLTYLATYQPPIPTYTDPLGLTLVVAAKAAAALCRRAALISLARATAGYQPPSYQDAAALRSSVCDLLDAAATDAADSGDAASYSALRALRVSVSQDLSARGSALPQLVSFSVQPGQPSLALAWRLYGDPERADKLANRAQASHPGFMPGSFVALSA